MAIQTIVRQFRDIDLNFIPNPVTGDIGVLLDNNDIKNSIKNLVLLNHYEAPFHPEVGGNVTHYLFENTTPLTLHYIRQSIIEVINNFEPRVTLIDVIVQGSLDANGFEVFLEYYITNQPDPLSVTVFLEGIN